MGERRTKIFLQKGLDTPLIKQPADLPVGLIAASRPPVKRSTTEMRYPDSSCTIKQGHRNRERRAGTREESQRSNDGNTGDVNDIVCKTGDDIDLG